MSDMFGAPIGIAAAETDQRQVVQGALLAQKTLGEIAAQPADLALKEAHARLYGAEADLKQAQVADQKTMQELAEGVAKARQAARQGVVLTADDLRGAKGEPKSLAEPYEEMLALAADRGVSPLVTEKLAKDAATIRKNEATAASAQAEEKVRRITAQEKSLEMIGAGASALLEGGPANYARLKAGMIEQTPPGQPSLVGWLPMDYASAVPLLRAAVTQSMKAKDKLRNDREAAMQPVKKALYQAQTGKAVAGTQLANQRYNLAVQKFNNIKKYDGDESESAHEGRQSMNTRRDVLNYTVMNKEYPQASADPASWVDGKPYRIGTTFFFARKGPDGKMGYEEIKDVPASYKKMAAGKSPKASVAPATGDETDDDEGEE